MNISLDVLEKSLYRMVNATLLAGILIYRLVYLFMSWCGCIYCGYY